jgi:hypothetical protein
MMKLTVMALVFSQASALQVDRGQPICGGNKDLSQKGKWVKLNDKQYTENFKPPGQQFGCQVSKLMWQPESCSLPQKASDITMQPRRTVFIGDSVQDVSAESFMWFLEKKQPHKNCSFTDELKPKLVDQGYSSATADHTVKWIQNQLTKGHRWWGCSDKVSYIPMHRMPDSHSHEMIKALMFAVKNFGDEPLGPEDVIVLNWGLHYTNDKKDGQEKSINDLKAILDEWALWDKAGDAPKLIWRQVSPQHWGGVDGTWSPHHESSTSCSPIALGKANRLDLMAKRTDGFKHRNDMMFEEAVQKANLKIDGTKIAVLPIWRPTAERNDEHIGQTYEHATADCTHYCTHGPVNRLWNSGILTLYQDMRKSEQATA